MSEPASDPADRAEPASDPADRAEPANRAEPARDPAGRAEPARDPAGRAEPARDPAGRADPYPTAFFRRQDESPDPGFYTFPRFVTHLDEAAIAAVRSLYDELLAEGAVVLDLCSSWRSHLPEGRAGRVVGLGLNAEEMADNPQLDEALVHDLNADPRLPFDDASFDAALCCVSVQYLTRPVEVFAEVARVLRPGGPVAVTFSNRCFPPKAVAAWLSGDDRQHAALVADYLRRAPGLGDVVASDRSPRRGDPLYAVVARRAD